MRTTNRPADSVGGERPAGRRPLHPAVNHMPIGGIVAAAIFDAVSTIAGGGDGLNVAARTPTPEAARRGSP